MDTRVRSWHALAVLNARLFRNCLADVDDVVARSRPADRVNSMAFLAIHLIEARHFVLALLGDQRPRPFGDRFDSVTRVDEVTEYPPVGDLLRSWDLLSAGLDQALSRVEADALDVPASHGYPLPTDDSSVNGSLAFMFQHESYHVGQLAILRKLSGLPAMRYG